MSSEGTLPKILVIDDDDRLRAALVRLLTSSGHEVVEARSRMACGFALRAGVFDAVIADLNMPGCEHLDILQVIRERDADVPIVVVSGSATVDRAINALEFGVFRFLTKPFNATVLLETVARAAARRAAGRSVLLEAEPAVVRPPGWFDRGLEQVWLAVQPIVDSRTERPVAFEALLRGDLDGLQRPDQILYAAFAEGRFAELTRVIRSRACGLVADLPVDCSLFVNLHPIELLDETLMDLSGLAGHANRIVLEVTERASLSEVEDSRARVQVLRAAGFRVAVDDLGAGYSGLSSVTDLEPDTVKLDMALVRDVWQSPVKKSVVRAMTELCSELEITLIAEGVETPQERRALEELGVKFMQGYLFGRPTRHFPSSDLAQTG